MKRNWKLLLAALLAIGVQATAQAQVKTAMINGVERPLYREGEVIVKYKDGQTRTMNAMNALYDRISVVNVKRFNGEFKNFEHLMFDTTHMTVEQVIADLSRDADVEYVQPNYMIYASPMKSALKPLAPCIIPGLPFPPGCEDGGGGGETPPPGDQPKTPCIIPGLPFPPGCEDSGGGGGGGGGGEQPKPGEQPAIEPAPADVNPPVADPNLSQAWGIAKTQSDKAWAINKGSKNVIVAVIDTGIDYNHEDISFNMWRNPNAQRIALTGIDPSGSDVTGDVVGYDFANNDALPYDDNMHGTHCAGVIGAVGGNGKGIAGVNQRVSLMAVKFLTGEGSGDSASAIRGIDYAVSRGAKVLSNSWGGKGDDGSNNALKDSVERAGKAGVLFVAAAGNDGTDNDKDPTFPASFNTDNMVTVAATTETDGIAFFSNKGAKTVHVGAPGTNVYSTTPKNTYQKLSGTSMACPHVAGAAALILAQNPSATYGQIKKILMDTGDVLPALSGKTVTGKRINVLKALEAKL